MVKELTLEERTYLHRFLQAHFNLAELKNMIFDLGIDSESLPHSTKGELSRELISYFERRNNLNCLVQEIVSLRDSDEMVGLLARLPPCIPRSKVEIITRGTDKKLPEDLVARLAEWAGISGEEVKLIKGVPGSTHLLFSVPKEGLLSLTNRPSDLWKKITPFEALDDLSQVAWRVVAVFLPVTTDELLNGEILWDEIVGLIAISKRSLQKARIDPTEQAAYHFYAGLLLLRMERWGDAILSFDETVALAPTFSLAYLNRGFAYEALGRDDFAVGDYDRALQLDRTLVEGYIARGASFVKNLQLPNALNDFDHAIRLNPKSEISHLNRGGLFYRMKRYDEALHDFNETIRLAELDKRAYFGRALTLAKLRQYDDAIKDFTRVIELDPQDARAYMARGTTYQRMRLYADALHDVEMAHNLGDTRAADYIEEIKELIRPTSYRYSKAIRALSKSESDKEESSVEVGSATEGSETETQESNLEAWES